MPTISRQQAQALRVLEWLNSDSLESRRSGRTFIMALAALRNACNHPNRWEPIEDHHHTAQADHLLLSMIGNLAREAGAELDVDEARRRFRVIGQHPDARRYVFEAFAEGNINLGIPEAELRRMRTARGEREPVPEPEIERRSSWERLGEDDPV